MRQVDIAVIGAGVAGLTAAATAAARGANTLLIEALGAGGQVSTVDRIANFPGQAEPVAGYDLGPIMQEQAEAAGAEVMLGTVSGLAPDADGVTFDCDGVAIRARLVIVAAGSSRRKLGVPGEEVLEGRGVSHCASCDGPMYRGMHVLVAGGGDSALDEALVLAGQADRVTVAFPGAVPHAQAATRAQVAAQPKITLRPGMTVDAVQGDGVVKGAVLRDMASGATETLPVDGVFVYVGLAPNTGFLGGVVDLDGGGHVVTDAALRTSHPRILAAGDIRAGSAGLLTTAAGDGALAAVTACALLAGGAA